MEPNGLDTLVALRILIEALRLEGVRTQSGGRENRQRGKELVKAGTGRRQVRQDKAGKG